MEVAPESGQGDVDDRGVQDRHKHGGHIDDRHGHLLVEISPWHPAMLHRVTELVTH
jgi:hypothetical protein